MNQPLPYEIAIAEKLDQLSVPDMVDAIWARIEKQLDPEPPGDEGPAEPPVQPTAGPGWNFFAGLSFTGILLYVLFTTYRPEPLQNQIPARKPKPAESLPQQTIITTPASPPDKKPNRPFNSNAAPPAVHRDDKETFLSPAVVDATAETAIPDPDPETATPLKKQDPDTIPKKKRGVRGVDDRDYRIIPKE